MERERAGQRERGGAEAVLEADPEGDAEGVAEGVADPACRALVFGAVFDLRGGAESEVFVRSVRRGKRVFSVCCPGCCSYE